MALKHVNPQYADRVAVAPYNFVPLPDKVLMAATPADQDEYTATGYTGYFDCELETSSPTYIRGMVLDQQFAAGKQNKDLPAPFSLDGGLTPLLPGSSLRGMIRQLVEIVSYSKMSWVTDEKLVYRAVGDTTNHGQDYRQRIMHEEHKNHFIPLMRGGYMREWEGDWYIQPAQDIGGTTFARIAHSRIPPELDHWHSSRNARRIYIQPGPFAYQDVKGGFLKIKYSKVQREKGQPADGLVEAALSVSGDIHKKESEAVVFPPDPAKTQPEDWYKIDLGMVRAYLDQISSEQVALLGDRGVLVDWQPVLYLIENDRLVFFGHTMMLRIPYTRSPLDLVAEDLRRPTDIDLAESLFGYTKDQGPGVKRACGGRVFFSDARCLPGQSSLLDKEITPKVLGSPKPTTFQHYLEQTRPDDKHSLLDYDDQTRLRGHKLYWHKGATRITEIEEIDPNKLKHKTQLTRIRPIRTGVRFSFKIRFENLEAVELGALLWVLRLSSDPAYRFKLGMGKPLGMGAVKITTQVQLDNRLERYARLWNAQDSWVGGERPAADVEAVRAKAIGEFEDWVLAGLGGQTAQSLSQVPRIQHLLKLLAWPGPDVELTRYMEIEHPDATAKRGRRNEYKERPVLPDPLGVGAPVKGLRAPLVQHEEDTIRSTGPSQPTPQPLPKPQIEPLPEVRAEVSDEAKAAAEFMAKRAAEREAEEAKRKQERAERKKKK